MTSTSQWIVSQLGAREHYAIPRALLRAGESVGLRTDFWAGHSRWGIGRLRGRVHRDIASHLVTDFPSALLGFEALSRIRRRRGWPLIEARNDWFDRRVARSLHCEESPGTLFAYSYAARNTLAAARELGFRTILGQIDPGPVETRLVQERRRRGGLPPEPEPSSEYWKKWRSECELADAIVVNSPWSKRALEQEGIPAKRIEVVPLAFERGARKADPVDSLCRQYSSERPLKALFLGQVVVRKGILEVASAIERLADQPIEWTFVGTGELRLLERLRELPKTRVLGSVPRHEASRYYKESDLFLLPTHSDGFALTQLEAAAYGLPIIASRYCGEVVRHGENGLLLTEVTDDAIVEAILTILREPEQLAAFRQTQLQLPGRTLTDLATDLLGVESRISAQDRATHATP